jgi:hypothetical protein
MSVHGVRVGIAVGEIIWLVIAIGVLGIGSLLYAYFADNAMTSAQPEESDSEQGAFDDPHSEEWTR